MNGSRLGRGRGGRLAVYGGCTFVVIFLVFLYRTATTEMARLRELHLQCTNQQEALAAQLQVIFEYKVRLEKSLEEEKNSNAAAKRELQERANREKSLRDKDSIEALQRLNSLKQQYKILESEKLDLRDECEKNKKQAFEETKRLESTLQGLRSQLKKAKDDKEASMEHLKNKYMELDTEKTKIDEKYNELLKNTGNTDSTIEHLRKEVFQLKQDLEDAKSSCRATSSQINVPAANGPESDAAAAAASLKKPGDNGIQGASPSQQNYLLSTVAKISIGNNITKLNINTSSSTSSDKFPNAVVAPMKSVSRGKLPVGVPPIPKLVDPKLDKEESKITNPDRISLADDTARNKVGKNVNEQKDVLGHDSGKHGGDQGAGRQDNLFWYRVKQGFQEIGEEPNNLKKPIDFNDAAVHQGNDQYDFYKDIPQKNSDINLDEVEEGEEEGDDGDDPLEYQNNPDKHE